jgi:hypothetical protein
LRGRPGRSGRLDLGDPVGQGLTVLVCHGDVLADDEVVISEPVHGFIIVAGLPVVIEEPVLAAPSQATRHGVLVWCETADGTGLPGVGIGLGVQQARRGERGGEGIAPAIVAAERLTAEPPESRTVSANAMSAPLAIVNGKRAPLPS